MNEYNIEVSVDLFSLPDSDILNAFLSGDFIRERVSEEAADHCMCIVAKFFQNIIGMYNWQTQVT